MAGWVPASSELTEIEIGLMQSGRVNQCDDYVVALSPGLCCVTAACFGGPCHVLSDSADQRCIAPFSEYFPVPITVFNPIQLLIVS